MLFPIGIILTDGDWRKGLSYFGVGAAGGALMATGNVTAGGMVIGGGNSILT